ncbi:putative HIT-like protein [Zhongshania aliphaticivorans]|uniref:Putative HIT-like protein n=1 Tax=Zhongshania aliphaticivorans TaxID=1470434 RepID=A0A5S9NIZ5_9GAMM|nr:HIT family protein [Zhongshania aliphaticivorans]CAA0089751.1 putative HIT-like protein [Zhongshania aliphaticivorans]CAA0096718.1 putative HIT-like protein [Zhongshania aliphaticivorans]
MSSIFTKIIQGELPGHFVWEDEYAVAILTIEPIQDGHLLLIPRQEVDHWDDLPAELATHLMSVSQLLAKGLKKVFPCRRVSMMIIGLEVPHTHIHLLPINDMADANIANAKRADDSVLAETARKIREALA